MSLVSLTSVHRVAVQRCSSQPGATLGAELAWTTVAVLPARVRPLSSAERAAFARDGYRLTHRVYFSRDPAVDSRHRLVFQGRVLESLRPHDVHELRRLWIVDACEESQRNLAEPA